MNKEIENFDDELNSDEDEFDDFEDDFEDEALDDDLLDDFDEFDTDFDEDIDLNIEIKEMHFSELNFRTAILSKNNMFALLCLKTAKEGGAICRVDPREADPAYHLYDDPDKALNLFQKSINTSVKNGWSVIYNGLPLKG
ncbi:MAG: hypothetical protein ACK5NT_02275 [Pyrinomonadaceae bacterium]